MPSVYIKTYGCQMNERDSEAVAAQLAAKGYTLAASEGGGGRDFAQYVQRARHGGAKGHRQNATRWRRRVRRHRPEVVLGLLGCMAQSRGAQLLEQLPDVDLVIGTQKFHRTADYLDEILTGKRDKIVEVEAEAGSEAAIKEHWPHGNRDGERRGGAEGDRICQHHAGLQPVLHVLHRALHARRGTEPDDRGHRGRVPAIGGARRPGDYAAGADRDQLREARNSGAGRQIRLLCNCWRRCMRWRGWSASGSLRRIRKATGTIWWRPTGACPKLCESAHLPAQSGSDRILKLMHRGCTREKILSIVDKLRRAQPRMGITTDLIVGFPGETEEDFAETLALARAAEFDNGYLFKYSPRRDTPAAAMPGQVPQAVKEERNARLLALVNEIGARRYEAQAGQRMEVLVEGPSRRNAARQMGRTRCNRIVVFEDGKDRRGELVKLRMERAGSFTLYGTFDEK